MKRTLVAVVLTLAMIGASCGGGDDDDDVAASSSEGDSPVDFCDAWPKLSAQTTERTPSPDDIDDAQALLDDVRASTPKEIKTQVGHFADFIERILDSVESGDEADTENLFGEVFGLALADGPPIEAYLKEHCPDYVPSTFEDDGTGSLGIPDGDLDAMVRDVFGDTNGADSSSSFDDFHWTIYTKGTAEDALVGCTQLSERLAAHEAATGTLVLTIGDDDGTPLAVNKRIESGDPGSCEAA